MCFLVCSGFVALFEGDCRYSVEVRAVSFVRSGSLVINHYLLAVKIEFEDFNCDFNRVIAGFFGEKRVYTAEFYFYPIVSASVSMVPGGVDVSRGFYIGGGYHFYGTSRSGGEKLVRTWEVSGDVHGAFLGHLRRLDVEKAFRTIEKIVAEAVPINWEEFWSKAKCNKVGKKKLTIMMDVEVVEKLKIVATRTGRTMSDILEEKAREVIREFNL